MKIHPTTLDGVVLLTPPAFEDARGSFHPLFAQRLHSEAGYAHPWSEMNVSHTAPHCVRGLHFQDPNPQAKLITIIAGSILDVAVDLRPGPDFGRHETFRLSAEDKEQPSQIYLPAGFAHGIATFSQGATIAYLVSGAWDPASEKVLAWDDPELAIAWPNPAAELSDRDRAGLPLAELAALRRAAT